MDTYRNLQTAELSSRLKQMIRDHAGFCSANAGNREAIDAYEEEMMALQNELASRESYDPFNN